MDKLTHMDANGRPKMVDVGTKEDTQRLAEAAGAVYMAPETLNKIISQTIGKGDVLSVAQTAGIMGAKNTPYLIPMCHNILISGIEMDFTPDEETSSIQIKATAKTTGKTGVELEALTAVSIAALTVYDMCKAIDRGMRITDIRLIKKDGGKSGLYEQQ